MLSVWQAAAGFEIQLLDRFQEERMKIKLIAVVCLAAFLMLSGCKGSDNTNNANANANKTTPTPIVKTSETAAANPADVSKIEAALKKANFTDVKVDGTTTPATLTGTVPKGKLQEMMKVTTEAAGKPLTNKVTEK